MLAPRSQWLIVASALTLCLSLGACHAIGPRQVPIDRFDYNTAVANSSNEQMLLNLVRLRYNDSPLFLELGAVVAQYGFDASLSATGQVGSGVGEASVGTGLGYSESPTITYTPLKGEDFAQRLLTPVSLDSLMLFVQTGWSAERLLLMIVQRVNDLFNAPTATGPTPEHPPDYEAFADFATRFHRLYEAQLICDALSTHGGDVRPTIAALAIPRKTFYDKLKRHEIDINRFRHAR